MSSIEAASQVVRSFVEAFNRSDAAGIAAEFAEDGTVTGLGDAGLLRGRRAIEDAYRTLFGRTPDARIELDAVEARALGEERAITHASGRTYSGGAASKLDGTAVAERRGAAWKLVAMHMSPVEAETTRAARHRATMEHFYGLFGSEAFRRRDFSVLHTILAPDFVDRDPIPGQGPGIEGLAWAFALYYDAFPDFVIALDDVIVEGDQAAVRFTMQGTHRGAFLGIPPTERTIRSSAFGLIRFDEAGRPRERYGVADIAGIIQQLTS